jgi:uncharacterized Ntn-hydrolase superfamily protein
MPGPLPEVPRAMTAAFELTYEMPIAPRLIGALRAGEAAGSERRTRGLLTSICASTITARWSRSSCD